MGGHIVPPPRKFGDYIFCLLGRGRDVRESSAFLPDRVGTILKHDAGIDQKLAPTNQVLPWIALTVGNSPTS
jgi:hypothetical protein